METQTEQKIKNVKIALCKSLNEIEQKKRNKLKCCICNPKSNYSFLCDECIKRGWKLRSKKDFKIFNKEVLKE